MIKVALNLFNRVLDSQFCKIVHKKKPFNIVIKTIVAESNWPALAVLSEKLFTTKGVAQEDFELIAYSLQQANLLESAAKFSRRSTELFPDSWTLNFLAGVSLSGTGEEALACNYLRRALRLAPKDPQTLKQLIMAIAKSDSIELAALEYEKHCSLVKINIDFVVAPLKTLPDWASLYNTLLLDAGEIEEIPFKEPIIWNQHNSSEIIYTPSNKPYVANLNNVRIFSKSSIILTADGTALSDTAGHEELGKIVSLAYEDIVIAQKPGKLLLDLGKFNTREIDGGIYLSGLASNSFGHWMPEFLPKLQFLKIHPNFKNLPIIVDNDMPQTHFEHLTRLVNNPLLKLCNNESFICKNLLVAPSPSFFPVDTFPNKVPTHRLQGISPRAMHFIRGDTLNRATITPSRRIFLGRKNMKWRRLINEEEIGHNLAGLGFTTVFIEEMSAEKQIELFQEAEWIVAPNGSALLNLIFANTNTKLIVLSQPNLHNWGTFQGPMDSLGYKSICVCGDYAFDQNQKHSDYHVPVKFVREALAELGMNMSTISSAATST